MDCSILEYYLAACTATFWDKHTNTVYICEAHILQVPSVRQQKTVKTIQHCLFIFTLIIPTHTEVISKWSEPLKGSHDEKHMIKHITILIWVKLIPLEKSLE